MQGAMSSSARLALVASRAPARQAQRQPARVPRAVAGVEADSAAAAVEGAADQAVDPLKMLEAEAKRLTPADLASLTAKWDFAEDELDTEKLYAEFDQLLGTQSLNFSVGDRISGVVYKVDSRGAFVDIGAKAPAYLPLQEVAIERVGKVSDALQVGEEKEFEVIQGADRDGMMVVSIRKLLFEALWADFKQKMADDATVEGEIVSTNRGGSLVVVAGLRGFVPSSHMSPLLKADESIGTVIPCKLLEVDPERGRLVLSHRRALAEQQTTEYSVGDVVEGLVTSVKPYGAFVDIGATNGLLHISQISHDRLSSVDDVLQSGDRIKCMVLSQDSERNRISLSTKKLEPSPGDMLRNPGLVYEKAEEMAASFREKVALAEAAAREEESRLRAEGVTSFASSPPAESSSDE